MKSNKDKAGYLGDCPSGKAFWEYSHSSHPLLWGLAPCSRSSPCQNPLLKTKATLKKNAQLPFCFMAVFTGNPLLKNKETFLGSITFAVSGLPRYRFGSEPSKTDPEYTKHSSLFQCSIPKEWRTFCSKGCKQSYLALRLQILSHQDGCQLKIWACL